MYILPATFSDLSVASQQSLQSHLDGIQLQALKQGCSIRDRARINTIASPYAGAWLRVTPNRNLGLAMLQHEFIVTIRLWLDIPIFPAANSNNALRCICGQVIDRFGNHLLGCSYDSTLLKRHNALCNIMWHALLSDDKSCRREQNCSANHQSHPGDIYHPDFLNGNPAFLTSLSAIYCNHVLSALLPLNLVQLEMLGKWKKTRDMSLM